MQTIALKKLTDAVVYCCLY